MSEEAALGIAPHSGWAVLVALSAGNTGGPPCLLARERLVLIESGDPGAKHPYHVIEKLPLEEAGRRLASYEESSRRIAFEALEGCVKKLAASGHRAAVVGILGSSRGRAASLEATLASHPRLHAAEGEHFRDALAAAAESCKLALTRVPAPDLEARAAAAIGREPDALRVAVQSLRREAGPPWGADQKSAALLAWLILAERSAKR